MRSALVLLLALAASLAGCFDDGPPCGSGVCPIDTVCDRIHTRCVYPEQMTSCTGAPDDTECTIGGQAIGTCQAEVCLRATCGDGIARGNEDCDGSDFKGHHDCSDLGLGYHEARPLRCSDDCQLDLSACGPRCGDGVIDAGEACDAVGGVGARTCASEGFYGGELRCSASCSLDASACIGRCGDGVRTAGEECDGTDFGGQSCTTRGFYGGNLACGAGCDRVDTAACVGACGDGARNGPEICDSGDLASLSCESYGWYGGALTCAADCVGVDKAGCVGYCGDGIVNGNEQCDGPGSCTDLGARGGALGCDAFCRPVSDRCNFDKWRPRTVPSHDHLVDVWAPAWNDVSLVTRPFDGDSVILHFDGGAWAPRPSPLPKLRAIWGTSSSDLWVGGDGRDVAHFDGTTWTTMDVGFTDVDDLWGTRPDDVWAVGGAVAHFDGVAWTAYDIGTFSAVGGTGTDDVWMVRTGIVLHLDHGTWRYEALPFSGRWDRLWTDGPDDVWITSRTIVAHYDGETWTQTTLPAGVNGIWGTARDDVWVAQRAGLARHFDGTTWTAYASDSGRDFNGGWSTGPGDVWAFGDAGALRHLDGTGWSHVDEHAYVGAMWSSAPDDVWAVGAEPGGGFFRHFDGATWSRVETGIVDPIAMEAMWGTGRGQVWALANLPGGPVYQLDRGTWISHRLPEDHSFTDLWARDDADVWVVGDGGRVMHYDGHAWSPVDIGTDAPLSAIHATGSDDLWVVGGAVAHYDGATWTSTPRAADDSLVDVWSNGRHDVWAIGGDRIEHYDGISWRVQHLGSEAYLSRIWGSGPTDMWIVGQLGLALHFDGTSWSRFDIGTSDSLYSVWGDGHEHVWASAALGQYRLAVSWPHVYGGTCSDANPIFCGSSVNGSLERATFKLINPVTGRVTVTMTPFDSDLDAAVLDSDARGACSSGSPRATGASRGLAPEVLRFDARQGETLYLVAQPPADPGAPATSPSASYLLTVSCEKR